MASEAPSLTPNESVLEKIWMIQCEDGKKELNVGGICVSSEGYILTTAVGIQDPNVSNLKISVRGRSFSSKWYTLKFIFQKRNFNLTLLKVEKTNTKFPYFNLDDLDESIDLNVGDELVGVFHILRLPFGARHGFSSYPFFDVHFPDIHSRKTLFNTKNEQQKIEVYSAPIRYLCVGHVIDGVETDDAYDTCYREDDGHVDPNLRYLDPNMPVIQSQGLGDGLNGGFGCPVFDCKGGLVGLYNFYTREYVYILAHPFLNLFFTHAMSLHGKKRKMSIKDSPLDSSNQMRRKSATTPLNEATKLKHKPRMNATIPALTDVWYARGRLLQRLQQGCGFDEEEVVGDGNCQFRALSVHIYGNPDEHEKVRKKVVDQLQACQKSYEDYVEETFYTQYLKKMATPLKWGDHITLQAAADKFNIKICLFTLQKGDEDACVIEILPEGRSVPFKKEIWLSHWSKVYYNPLRKIQGSRAGGSAGGRAGGVHDRLLALIYPKGGRP